MEFVMTVNIRKASQASAAEASAGVDEATHANAQPKRKRKLPKLPKPTPSAKRQMSSIPFPYVDLDGIAAMARAMHENGGLALTRDQLAGALKQSPGSGSFALKMGAARQYGVVEQTPEGRLQLTNLGFAIVSKDDATE